MGRQLCNRLWLCPQLSWRDDGLLPGLQLQGGVSYRLFFSSCCATGLLLRHFISSITRSIILLYSAAATLASIRPFIYRGNWIGEKPYSTSGPAEPEGGDGQSGSNEGADNGQSDQPSGPGEESPSLPSDQVQESQSLPSQLQDYIVREHNALRGQVWPPATNMKTMVSVELELVVRHQ